MNENPEEIAAAYGIDPIVPGPKARKILGVGETKYFEMIRLGLLPTYKFGRTNGHKASDLRKVIEDARAA